MAHKFNRIVVERANLASLVSNSEVRINRKQTVSGLNFNVNVAESSRFILCVYLTFCY